MLVVFYVGGVVFYVVVFYAVWLIGFWVWWFLWVCLVGVGG